jgi:hypothetical protein
MANTKVKKTVGKLGSGRTKRVVSIFKNEDSIFSETLKQHRHDKSFFISMAQKAGIYDTSGNLESSYRR